MTTVGRSRKFNSKRPDVDEVVFFLMFLCVAVMLFGALKITRIEMDHNDRLIRQTRNIVTQLCT